MKETAKSLFAGALILLCSFVSNALPLVWRADWPDAKPVETLVHRGTDIELQPLWRINKEIADTNGWTFSTFCQTNAVGPWFGPMPGAFFSHTNDVGAAFYNVMVRAETPGGAVNYTAFARLRMLDSPGFAPGHLPLPAKSIDFAEVEVFNAPWLLPRATNDIGAIKVELGSLSNSVSTLSDTKADRSELATVATSGSYNNLSNKPQINGVSLSGNKTGADLGVLDLAGGTVAGKFQVGASFAGNFQVVPAEDTNNYSPTMRFGDGAGVVGIAWSVETGFVEMIVSDIMGTHHRIELPSASGTLALTSDIPTVPTAQINSATTTNALQDTAIRDLLNDNAQTRQIVTTWENFLGGSNVVFSITNYISGTYNLDAAKMTIKELREGEYREVYNSRNEILLHIQDFKDNDFRAATNQVIGAVNDAIGSKADKDWGKYTSAGGEAPENTVYMTAPNTVFAGGLEYERVAVGEGTICVLTTHGAPVWTQGDEGTFKFQDDGGTNYFGFAKTDSYTIGANTDSITVQGGMVTMTYNITMSGRPCVWYKADLTSDTPWEQLNLSDGSPVAGASHAVTWEQNPPAGTQVCYINVGNQPSGFFKATVEVAGEAKFMTNMKADLNGGIICPNTATGVNGVIKPSYNGSTVIWTWSAD